MLRIYFKPTCSTCRTALSLIKEETDENIEIIEYLKKTPTQKEIREILKMLGLKAEELVRKKEDLYKAKYVNKKLTETQWIKVLVENPILIERPIIVKDGKAILGRPAVRVKELF